MEEGIHRRCRTEPDIIEGPKRLNLELWVLELEARGRFDWIERKELSLGLFIKRLNTKSLPRDRLGLAFNRGDVPTGTVGLTTPVLVGIPE